jgi:hypothetical protein
VVALKQRIRSRVVQNSVRSRNAVVALKPSPAGRPPAGGRRSRNAVVALKPEQHEAVPFREGVKQERRGGIETVYPGFKLIYKLRSRNAVVALKLWATP